jgi:predicted MFS family arabinose efflux permease
MDQTPAKRASQPLLAALFSGDRYSSLALPQYRWLLAGTAFSQVAAWMEEVARGWLVVELLNGSPFQLGLLGFVRGFSQLLMSPFAGVLAERLDRRRLAAITQFVPALDAVIIAALVGTGHIAMWQMYPLVAVSGTAGAVNVPVRQVLVYDVVGGEQIVNAIALNSVVANVSRIIAPAAGGVVIATVGIAASYYAQVVFFALATVATFALHPITHAEPVRTPMFQSIREGFAYVRHDPTMARLVLLNTIPNLLIYPYVALIPIFAKDIMHVGSAGYGVLLTGVGVGSIPGGLIVAGMTNSPWKGRVMGLSACLYMGMVTLFALSTVFVLSFAILVVAGVGWSMMVTLNQTLLQIHVADEFRGRIVSLYTMATGTTPFGNLGMGALADGIGVQAAVASFALTALALATVLGIGSKLVREL